MKRIRVLPKAKGDIRAIGDYIAIDDPDRAAAFVLSVEQRIALLKEFPAAGRSVSSAIGEIGLFPFKQYVVLYRIEPKTVDIPRILHGARDLARFLGDHKELE